MEALKSKCNIIPVYDQFEPPKKENLPEDMQEILSYNAVKWDHTYQDTSIDKIEK